MSKGTSPRPFSITQEEFSANFDRIFRKVDPREIEDAKNEDEEFKYLENLNKNKISKDSQQSG